jgi:hypothetical protein
MYIHNLLIVEISIYNDKKNTLPVWWRKKAMFNNNIANILIFYVFQLYGKKREKLQFVLICFPILQINSILKKIK